MEFQFCVGDAPTPPSETTMPYVSDRNCVVARETVIAYLKSEQLLCFRFTRQVSHTVSSGSYVRPPTPHHSSSSSISLTSPLTSRYSFWANNGSMLGQRRRRWTSIEPLLARRLSLLGIKLWQSVE